MIDLLKKQVTVVAQLMPNDFSCDVYFKDKPLTALNKNLPIFYNLLLKPKSLILRDLFNTENPLEDAFFDRKSKVIHIGKNVIKIGNLNFVDNILFIFYHEIGHAVFDYFDKNQDELRHEMFADCFAIYMCTKDKPHLFKPLMAEIMRFRENNSQINSGINSSYLYDVLPALWHFSKQKIGNYNLLSVYNTIMQSVNYGYNSIAHYKSLNTPTINEFNLSLEDIIENQQKFNVFENYKQYLNKKPESFFNDLGVDVSKKMIVDILADVHANAFGNKKIANFIEKNRVDNLCISNYYVDKNIKFKDTLIDCINKFYYVPNKVLKMRNN